MKVLVYPEDKNPYQQLLYQNFERSVKITFLSNPTKSHILGVLLLPALLIIYRLKGNTIFHLHWVYTFQFTVKNKFFYSFPFQLFFTLYFLWVLVVTKLLGYKLIWTVHDVVPHGHQFVNDLFISKVLSLVSSEKIVHSKATIAEMKKLGINTKNINIIPIGNYSDVYPNSLTKFESRKRLGLRSTDLIFGFFGRVEYYKGIIELVEAFNGLKTEKAKLLIAGPCFDDSLAEKLKQYSKMNKSIKLFLSFIPDEEVQQYLNSADIFVFPFKRITTSSSVILAMSFKRTVICPLIGEIVDIPPDTGFFYEQNGHISCQSIMNDVLRNPKLVLEKEEKAYKYAMSRSWKNISEATMNVYKS